RRVEWTGGALLARAAAFREGLRRRGLAAGERVALWAPNLADWVALDLAAFAEGVVLVPIDPRAAAEERARIVADADPALLVVSGEASGAAPPGGARPCVALAALAREGSSWSAPRPARGDEPATIIYTSGSSGEPKGTVLRWQNLEFMLSHTEDRLAQLTGLPAGAERALHFLPLCYAGSRILLWSALLRGARLTLLRDPRRLAACAPEAAPDYFLCVPLILDRLRAAACSALSARVPRLAPLLRRGLLACERIERGEGRWRDRLALALCRRLVLDRLRARLGGRLRGLICGSAPLRPDTQRFFHAAGIDVYQGYGLTETTALCTLDRPHAVRPGWVGHALPGVELRLADDGELLARGPNVFAGYWRRPAATRAAFDGEGWFRTGDLAEVDAAGRWRILGRKGALLVLSTGHNVAPEPVEEALRAALAARDGAWAEAQPVVFGHGRPHLAALVAPPPDAAIDPATLADAIEEVNAVRSPKEGIHAHRLLAEPFSCENGLLTPNLKLRRSAIAARYASLLASLYEEAAAARAP
ncbi:MAG: hypothetical protein D6731_24570, partial [Planctomycetota bacterium]